MANSLFELARQKFLGATLDWDGQTFSAVLMDLTPSTSDAGIRQITSSTNATPIVVTTAVAHGFTTGDLVYVDGIATGTAGNGVWLIAAASGSVFSLTDPISGANAVGNGIGAGGYCVNLGPSTSADFWDDFDASLVGGASGKVNLTSPTIVQGVADAADVVFTAITGNSVEAIGIIRDTGTAGTSEMVAIITGKHIVTVNTQANSSATSIFVEPLKYGIPNGTVIAFSNGVSATLSALANAGDRVLTVSALAANVTAGSRGLAPATGGGLPVTPNGGNITVTWDNGSSKIFKL
jgi:hypothetical protein